MCIFIHIYKYINIQVYKHVYVYIYTHNCQHWYVQFDFIMEMSWWLWRMRTTDHHGWTMVNHKHIYAIID